jgi:galactitol-specific phosphotransferase system IIB component
MTRLTPEQIDLIVEQTVDRVLSKLDVTHVVEKVAADVIDRAISQIKIELVPAVTDQVYNNFYAQVGKVFVFRVLWATGFLIVMAAMYFVGTGQMKVGK